MAGTDKSTEPASEKISALRLEIDMTIITLILAVILIVLFGFWRGIGYTILTLIFLFLGFAIVISTADAGTAVADRDPATNWRLT